MPSTYLYKFMTVTYRSLRFNLSAMFVRHRCVVQSDGAGFTTSMRQCAGGGDMYSFYVVVLRTKTVVTEDFERYSQEEPRGPDSAYGRYCYFWIHDIQLVERSRCVATVLNTFFSRIVLYADYSVL